MNPPFFKTLFGMVMALALAGTLLGLVIYVLVAVILYKIILGMDVPHTP